MLLFCVGGDLLIRNYHVVNFSSLDNKKAFVILIRHGNRKLRNHKTFTEETESQLFKPI